jgi:hypothetical protein
VHREVLSKWAPRGNGAGMRQRGRGDPLRAPRPGHLRWVLNWPTQRARPAGHPAAGRAEE